MPSESDKNELSERNEEEYQIIFISLIYYLFKIIDEINTFFKDSKLKFY